jgi:hypothetical protein
MSGTHHGSIFEVAATGEHVSFHLHEFHAIKDGRVTTTWHMEDWFGLFLQPALDGSRPHSAYVDDVRCGGCAKRVLPRGIVASSNLIPIEILDWK